MEYRINAAVGCDKGRVRRKNEDNLYYNGRILPEDHEGIRHPARKVFRADEEPLFCIFDGMGGESGGEIASYTAASAVAEYMKRKNIYLEDPRGFLSRLCEAANEAVCEAGDDLFEGRMGSTLVSLFFTADEVYCCNLGDSRAFRYRSNTLQVLTKDHVEMQVPGTKHKPALTQYLGVYPDEMILVPHIAKGDLKKGDTYLICSDGLTDMLTNIEICSVIRESISVRRCVEKLIAIANGRGGKDNISIILCRVE